MEVPLIFDKAISPGSEEKLAACKDLGADVCINYKSEDFAARVKEETQGKGIFSIARRLFQPAILILLVHAICSFWNLKRN